MRKFLISILCLLASTAYADNLPLMGVGSGGSSPGYTGPGDLVASWNAWYGLRAFSAAKRGSNAINICDPANVTCADWKTDATTGNLVATTNPLNGTDCTVSTSCTVKIIYDQSGANSCGGVACDVSQTTAAQRPTLTWNCQNGHPCMVFVAASTMEIFNSTGFAQAQPFMFSTVSIRTAGTVEEDLFVFGGPVTYGYNTANDMFIFAGSVFNAGSILDNSFHAVQATVNGASSEISADGSATSGSAGATNITASTMILGNSSHALDGKYVEAGIAPGAWNSTQKSQMNSNQHTYWGF